MNEMLEQIEFQAWPKIPRLNRSMVVTEKIDGTNAAVLITGDGQVGAQSRKRLITPEDDNYGFAAWVQEHREVLIDRLGPGRHFGEWWGRGIQRGYGLDERRFSLFNTSRWDSDVVADVPGLAVVPVLYAGGFDTRLVNELVTELQIVGSIAAPPFSRPEGVCVYLPASNSSFKVMVENDEVPKGAAV